MYVVLVILLVNRIISAENSSEERFIDLLPEKEKQEFLEKIARRIFSGIESKDDRDGVSGEVSDTELDSQSAFVNKILKEESRDMRKNGGKDEKVDDLNQKIDKKGTLDKKDDATDNTQLVDLTLRDNVRDKRNSLTNTDEDSEIVRINVETKREEEKEERTGSDREDIQIKHDPRPSVRNLNDLVMTESATVNLDVENEKDDKVSQSNSYESGKNGKSLETELDPNNAPSITAVKHDRDFTKEIKDSQENHDTSSIILKENKSNGNIDVNDKYADSHKHSTKENGLHKSSEETVLIPLASESTTENEPTTNTKPTINETVKLITSDENTEANKNVNSKNRSFRSDTESTNFKIEPKKDSAVEPRRDANIEIVSVAMGNVNDVNEAHLSDTIKNDLHKENIKENKNLELIKNQENNENINLKLIHNYENNEEPKNVNLEMIENKEKYEESDNVRPEITTRLSNTAKDTEDEVTAKKIIDTTTLKTEALTKASMRAGKEYISDFFETHAISDRDNITPDDKTNNKILKQRKKFKTIGKNVKKKKGKNDEIDKKNMRFINDMIKVLRDKLKQNANDNELKMIPLNKALKQEKYMNVYEVPADKTPFTNEERINKNKENPYYVPVYNYAPDNAYYNPHNKFGPNANDNKADIIDLNDIDKKENANNREDIDEDNVSVEKVKREKQKYKYGNNLKDTGSFVDRIIKEYTKYKNQRKFKFGNRYKTQKPHYKTQNFHYKLNLPIVVKYPKFTDIILNPNDYLDMDYNNDRKLEIPNVRSGCEEQKDIETVSNEDEDTSNLKSRIRIARQWLYENKMFGYKPAITSKPEGKDSTDKSIIRSNENQSIAMDYYFGKSESFENDEDKEIYKNDENNPSSLYHDEEFELRSNKQQILKESVRMHKSKDRTARPLKVNTRSNELDTYVDVLKDMVANNAKSLKTFDWLGTTVDIQSALYKFREMMNAVKNKISLSRPDLQLLKYSIYLHKATKSGRIYMRSKMLPRNRKKRRGFIKDSGLIHRHWLIRMMAQKYDIVITRRDFDDFNDFINELQHYLFDLHTAIQKIASITNYKKQNWFENLKDLHLDTTRKTLLEVLLHMTSTRLLDLIENAAQNGVEDDYQTFVLNNEREVERTNEEMGFVLQIIKEMEK